LCVCIAEIVLLTA